MPQCTQGAIKDPMAPVINPMTPEIIAVYVSMCTLYFVVFTTPSGMMTRIRPPPTLLVGLAAKSLAGWIDMPHSMHRLWRTQPMCLGQHVKHVIRIAAKTQNNV